MTRFNNCKLYCILYIVYYKMNISNFILTLKREKQEKKTLAYFVANK